MAAAPSPPNTTPQQDRRCTRCGKLTNAPIEVSETERLCLECVQKLLHPARLA